MTCSGRRDLLPVLPSGGDTPEQDGAGNATLSLPRDAGQDRRDMVSDTLGSARASIVSSLRAVPGRLLASLLGRRGQSGRSLGPVLSQLAANLLDATAATGEAWATAIALTALEEAALAGEADAAQRLGNMYFFGGRVERDLELACRWFAQASLNGDIEAAFCLGLINAHDYDPPRGAVAMAWYQTAFLRGHRDAARCIGLLADEGRIVPRDIHLAERAFVAGARQGDMDAQFCLAELYYRERGLDPDYRRAFGWYAVAAEAGHGMAANNAASMLHRGLGAPHNLHWARRLAGLAVDRGVAGADTLLDTILSEILEAEAREQPPGYEALAAATVH